MVEADELINKRDSAIYQEYLKGLEYRAKSQADKFNLSLSRYKAILNEQKKLNRKQKKLQPIYLDEKWITVKDGK